ncbi:hypothetical protein DAPPUDRAFT_324794 [Daphnia pulex]|uniref:Uncharacterized protein n=1 Tax=Daphnia pulex TaxID=6669 RepID=E9H2Q7_DAPPU|nr:hypothetical protein DAPPUDRAFT_324794 [Daphnia pulex]|eukprot:EFX74018.1 hypothetical protein DAPPUDRAFT_324794 [Daphnia pulex]
MHCDFERATMNALAEVIIGIICGCYYHYCQTLHRRVTEVCLLGREYHSVPLVKKIVKLLGSLPYLHPTTLNQGFGGNYIDYVTKI